MDTRAFRRKEKNSFAFLVLLTIDNQISAQQIPKKSVCYGVPKI